MLGRISSPKELKKLTVEQLNMLAAEIRSRMVDVVSSCGGHLASSLGAVELTLALHYCLDTPKDKIVWDVGHQAYAHKIITGRNEQFDTLRQYNGLSGFPCKTESEYDPFTSGHSSNAVSLALGLASARDTLDKDNKFKVVAVIGDGSLSGGLCFEGLNNTGHLKKDILVVLNTNELSIAPNVGAISTYLNKLISLPIYNRFKAQLETFMTTRVPRGSRILKMADKFEEGIKALFVPGMLFEELGFRYFGPFDGHDLNHLIPTLKNILEIKGPRILHVFTKKGKGYLPAEKDPVRFHGTGPFDKITGQAKQVEKANALSYTSVFGSKIVELAKENDKIVAVTAAMPEGTGLDKFRDTFPNRFFDVGIAEGHAVCFSAGLARGGLKPVFAVYSTFLQRAFDQLIEDAALQDSAIVFCVDRAGIVGEDGMTHQGIFDIAYLRSVPNMTLMAPKDAKELEMMLEFAFSLNSPVAIRYPRANTPAVSLPKENIEKGKPQVICEGADFMVIALGSMVEPAFEAIELLRKNGLSGTLLNARFVKPLDAKLLKALAAKHKFIFTIEEGILEGGFGAAVYEATQIAPYSIGLPCDFIPHGKRGIILEKYGLTANKIAEKIKSILCRK
ncbi:MAG: 1-deoxy-D-xylulose-5-phosphate synthase [Candidatus Omnitrophica bacterium]|nr:1-deoxy-D-xylulose-5-phosphate synthase [Candidatus Omnitrophota bacterium]